MLLTFFCFICIFVTLIPRLCNGSTSDSGSDCGGSNPPWGTQAESGMIQLFLCLNFICKFARFDIKMRVHVA